MEQVPDDIHQNNLKKHIDRKDDLSPESDKLVLSSNNYNHPAFNIPWKPIIEGATFSGGGNSLDDGDSTTQEQLEQSRALNTRAVKINEKNITSCEIEDINCIHALGGGEDYKIFQVI